jgi:quinol monooxygenase YgiN
MITTPSAKIHGFGAALLLTAAMVAATTAAYAQTPAPADDQPLFAATYLDVGVDSIDKGVALLRTLRDAAQKEADNVEFTVLQETDRPNRFVTVQGWKSKAAFDAHGKGAAETAFEAALMPIRNSPPDTKMLQTYSNAPVARMPAGAVYMIEHIDFLGGDPGIAERAAPLIKTLAEASRTEPGVLRYDAYRMTPPRVNHYEVVAAWPDKKAFDAHQLSQGVVEFRATTAQGSRAWRCNLYDQRLYTAL